jgi:hypothetical protein
MRCPVITRVGGVLLIGALALAMGQVALAQPPSQPKDAPQLSGPFTHDNLTIFLIHGPDRFTLKNYLTLPEALEQKKAVIHETQTVNQLSVENLSPTEELLILSGDILKGGQQDRFAQFDQIVPPKSGKMPLRVYCVELTAARWMRRLEGDDKSFKASPGQVAANAIRLEGRLHMSQSRVWKNVELTQRNLSANAGSSVKVPASESSLALSQQVKQVKEAADKYVHKLASILQDKKDVVGYVFAINGKLICADTYGASGLFRKVWPRLIQASAIEAFSELDKAKKFEPVTQASVRTFLAEAEKGKASRQDVSKGIYQRTRESERNVLFECVDEKRQQVLRCSVLAK